MNEAGIHMYQSDTLVCAAIKPATNPVSITTNVPANTNKSFKIDFIYI